MHESGADEICNARATEAGLPGAGTYKAWLSDGALNPNERFARSLVDPYVLVDGTVVAANWGDLIVSPLASPINLDENGLLSPNLAVWTATATNALQSGTFCADWTDGTSGTAEAGNSSATVDWSTATGALGCAGPARLVYFQQ